MRNISTHARVTTKGQVTIPVEIRRALGIEEGDEVVFRIDREGEAGLHVVKRVDLMSLAGILASSTPSAGKEEERRAVGTYLGRRAEDESRGDE